MYDDDAQHWVGKTFAGTWRIERVLGTGGMGSVLLGWAADGSQAALKVLHPELNAISEVRKRFLREGFIGNTFGGADAVPGVVRVLGSGETPEGLAYLVMEVLQGETLFDRMARTGTMPPGEVLALADQVLETLAVAHARGVVHRDLKPENIHLGVDGRVRMLDFGIARVVDGLTGLPEKTATKTGMIMGTATYMAPEQATGLIHDIDGRTDLFGLGATMFRLLSGRQVHGDVTEAMEVIAAATEPAPPLTSVAPGISPAVAAVVDRSLAFIKFHRYPNAETMRADVRAVRLGQPPPYAQAVLEGRIRAGQPLSQPAPPPTPLPPAAVSPSARPQPTVPEPMAVTGAPMSRPERTLRDDSMTSPPGAGGFARAGASLTQLSTGKLLLLVGGASLATGVLVAIVVLLLVSC
ncbi:protein kinase [Sorangium cellulosum]|uniref:Protein kinase n=1 Tax=Sorangium cellulosum TaxID=56 RepID=A0A2L0F998_SORCE|nr:serine/threonine-protein kinase [Sorangium cellulosum]AUX48155.1 protein kinase [Sorangium cellulosum]